MSCENKSLLYLRLEFVAFGFVMTLRPKGMVKALEAKVAQDGLIFTESQLPALKRKEEEERAKSKIETFHPGYLGSQNT